MITPSITSWKPDHRTARYAVMETDGQNWLAQLLSVPYETRLVVDLRRRMDVQNGCSLWQPGTSLWTATTRPTARKLRKCVAEDPGICHR